MAEKKITKIEEHKESNISEVVEEPKSSKGKSKKKTEEVEITDVSENKTFFLEKMFKSSVREFLENSALKYF